MKPAEAIDYFERKKIVTKTEFNKLSKEAKAGAFAVSGIYREDVLEAFRFEITDGLESGRTQKDITKGFKEILAGKGHKELGDWHLESVTRTNMQMAYGVGRRRAMEEVADILPFWEYAAVMDDRTRPMHKALHGLIFPHDHPFWDTHFPPWGFMCRCTTISKLDMPENYDRSRPNPESTLIFDDDDLPAKAEYQTQVIDLKATKFSGVPQVQKLDKILESSAQKAKSTRILNHQNIPQVVVDKAKEIRLKRKEHLAGWDKDSNFVGEYIGEVDKVRFPNAVAPKIYDGFEIHNHPREKGSYFESFSEDDFFAMLDVKPRVSYVVTQNYLYQLRRPRNGWRADMEEKFPDVFERSYDKIALKMTKLAREKKLTIEQVEDLENHLIWKEIAKEFKLTYRRFKVEEL